MNNILNDPLVVRAVNFARNAHESIGQVRKYTGEPYINHPIAVMQIMLDHAVNPVSVAMLCAGVCHDVVEDTPITLAQVRDELGDEVAELVDWLTDVSRPLDGNRKTRKAMDLAHTAAAPIAAKSVKVADLIHNARDITASDPNFAWVYLREKRALLEVLADADPGLLKLAHEVLEESQQKLHTKA